MTDKLDQQLKDDLKNGKVTTPGGAICYIRKKDGEYIMKGGTGTHMLNVSCTDADRLRAHWDGFLQANDSAERDKPKRKQWTHHDEPLNPLADERVAYKGIWIEHMTFDDCSNVYVGKEGGEDPGSGGSGDLSASIAYAIGQGRWSDDAETPIDPWDLKTIAEVEKEYIAADLY